MNIDELAAVVEDLIEALDLQARVLESLIGHVEQVTVHLPEANEMSVVRSTLTGLHQRIKKLQEAERPAQ